jgi:hypothetical protein
LSFLCPYIRTASTASMAVATGTVTLGMHPSVLGFDVGVDFLHDVAHWTVAYYA